MLALALSAGFSLGRSVNKDSESLSQLSIRIPVAMSAQRAQKMKVVRYSLLLATLVPGDVRSCGGSFCTEPWLSAMLARMLVNDIGDALQCLQSGLPVPFPLLLPYSLTAKRAQCQLPLLGTRTGQV